MEQDDLERAIALTYELSLDNELANIAYQLPKLGYEGQKLEDLQALLIELGQSMAEDQILELGFCLDRLANLRACSVENPSEVFPVLRAV